jgi:hypothetical protein
MIYNNDYKCERIYIVPVGNDCRRVLMLSFNNIYNEFIDIDIYPDKIIWKVEKRNYNFMRCYDIDQLLRCLINQDKIKSSLF